MAETLTMTYREFGSNGHDYISSGFSATTGRTYYWFEVVSSTAAVVTYTDAFGTTHTSKTLQPGHQSDCSGAAPTVASGTIKAWINQRGG